jgi:3alpha(or 20beta)-hydroxysteroid dehydrogenase
MAQYEDLAGKVALITGAAGGQGSTEAEAFVAAGAKVFLTDVDKKGGEIAARFGEAARFRQHDVSSEADWQAVIDEAVKAFGRIDILVNNAGVFTPGTLTETSVESFDLHYQVNQLGTFLGVKSVIPVMRQQKSGSIINISSAAGVRGFPDMIAYTATKWAIQGMTKAMARELASAGIRVNSVHPGLVQTQMLGNHTEEGLAEIAAGVPLGRIGLPRDVCDLVLYLASDVSAYFTGAALVIDGGVSL